MGIYIRHRKSDAKVWVDADFSGKWFPGEDKDNPDMESSLSGFIVSYLACPVIWKPQLQI